MSSAALSGSCAGTRLTPKRVANWRAASPAGLVPLAAVSALWGVSSATKMFQRLPSFGGGARKSGWR